MDEDAYQATARRLANEILDRAKAAADVMATLPARRLAVNEIRSLIWWALVQGARNPEVILERERRWKIQQREKRRNRP